MSTMWPMFVAPIVSVLVGALLRKRTRHVYWTACCLCTFILGAAFYVGAARDPGPPYNAPSASAAVFVAAPMLETFGIERLARTAPSGVLAVSLGLLLYVPAFVATLMLAAGLGILTP